MKKWKLLLFLICFFTSIYVAAVENKKPQVCLNMIVKNESHVIERCLESVKPMIDYWVIVDTGSTDGTQEIIKKYMKGIPGELHERPWVNFEHNRNEALDLAKEKAEYLLFIDADDIYTYSPNFIRQNLDKDGYYVQIKYGGMTYNRVQLVKSSFGWRWVGVVHEVLVSPRPFSSEILNGVAMQIIGGGDRSQNPKKFEKDAALLEEAVAKDPGCARYRFYLAQSYRDARMSEKALENYQKRVEMGGWDEEVFRALLEIGHINEELEKPEDVVTASYCKAFQYRPSRAEPLYRLSSYYRRKDNHLLAYLTAKHGLGIKHSDDGLFVESWIYDYGLLFEFSISAYWIEKYEESYKACRKLLANKNLPDWIRECVERNITFVIPKVPALVSPVKTASNKG